MEAAGSGEGPTELLFSIPGISPATASRLGPFTPPAVPSTTPRASALSSAIASSGQPPFPAARVGSLCPLLPLCQLSHPGGPDLIWL